MRANQTSMVTWVADNLGVGPAPMSFAQLDALKDEGVTAIMNLCEEFPDLPVVQRNHGFEVYYLPVEDEEAPQLEALEKALAWLDEALYLGKKVYIHCRHGIGRTGTVLNAYLLRRGLGHRRAAATLKKLRSKPESFQQWWSIRKYGRKSGKLTVREPSLESRNQVDLGPFIKDYEELAGRAEELAAGNGDCPGRCGREHVRCCRTPVSLTLVEGVYLGSRVNLLLESHERLTLIERAAEASRRERDAAAGLGDGEYCLAEAGSVCPLLQDEKCLLFEARPLQCRTFELDADANRRFWGETLEPALETMSAQLYFAFVSEFPEACLPKFSLPDIVSGRYVQTFFHWVMQCSM